MIRNYNEKFGKKVMMQFTITMDEIFTNIKNKKFFEHDILNKENQEYINRQKER